MYSAKPAVNGEAGASEVLESALEDNDGIKDRPTDNRRARRYRRRELHRRLARLDLVDVLGAPTEAVDPVTGEVTEFRPVVRQVPRDDKFLGCGRRVRVAGAGVTLVIGADGSAGARGVQSCGSGWACAVCSGKIQQHRADELGKCLAWARAAGYTLAMVTLTVKHQRGDSLSSVWDSVSSGWAAVTGGTGAGYWGSEKLEAYLERLTRWETACAAKRAGIPGSRWPKGGAAGLAPVRRVGDRERFGILGWARAVEVTNGRNGWHVHVHAVLVLEGEKAAAKLAAEAAGASMFRRWVAGLGKVTGADGQPFTASAEDGGLDVSVTDAAEKKLADYLTKDEKLGDSRAKVIASHGKKAKKLAMEATLSDKKAGKSGGKTPFELLDAAGEGGPLFGLWLRLWHEWVDASAGRLALTWSAGLRELASLPPECLTDEEAANVDPGGEEVIRLTDSAWSSVWVDQLDLYEAGEAGGVSGLAAWLTDRRVPFELIPIPE